MTLLAITPDQFQSDALAWLGAIAAVATAVATTLALTLPKLAALKAQVEVLFQLHNKNAADIKSESTATQPVQPAVPAPQSASLKAILLPIALLALASLTGCAALTGLYSTVKTDADSPAGKALLADVTQSVVQVGLSVAMKNPAAAIADGISGAASAMRDYEGLPTAPSAATVAKAAAVGSGVAVVAQQVAPQIQSIIADAQSKGGVTPDEVIEAAAKGLDAVNKQINEAP